MSQITVSIFNANTVQVTVIVNNGPPFLIDSTSSASEFRPQTPAVAPLFVNGPATPGTIGIGPNCIAITPAGWMMPQFFPFTIPEAMPISSLQIYLYWNDDAGTGQAYFANSGQFFYQCSGQKLEPLVPLSAWPGAQFHYRFEAGSNDAASLVIHGCFDPDTIAPSDSPAPEKAAVSVRQKWGAIAQRYSVIVDQFSNPNIMLMVSTTVAEGTLPGSESIAAGLLVFAQTILAEVSAAASSSSATPPQPRKFAASAAVAFSAVVALAADILPVSVAATLAWTKPALIDPTALANMPAVAFIAPSGSVQFASAGSPQSQSATFPLSAFAIEFEKAFTDYDGAGGMLKLAQRAGVPGGDDPAEIEALWMVRWSATAGISVSFTDALIYFALKPMSKTLLNVKTGDSVISGADLDLLGRRFVTAFDAFFAPEMAGSIAILDGRYRTTYYDQITTAKTSLAKTIPRGLDNVVVSQRGMGSLAEAQDRFTQALLTALANAFEVTTIVQAPATVHAAGATSPGVTQPPLLYGAVVASGSPGAASPTDAQTPYTLTPGELDIDSGTPSTWLTSLLTVAQPDKQKALYLPLTYDITHLQHEIPDSEPAALSADTGRSWLKFLRPGDWPLRIAIAHQAGIPIPLIFAPTRPSLNSQSATASPLSPPASTSIQAELDGALRWDYTLEVTPNWSAQDDLFFNVTYEVVLAASSFQAQSSGAPEEARIVLLQALADFLSWYQESLPQFPTIVKEAFPATTELATADAPSPNDPAQLVATFATKSAAVARAWAALYEPMAAFGKLAEKQIGDSFQIRRGNRSPQTLSLSARSDVPNASNPVYWPTVTVYSGDESESWAPDSSQTQTAGSPNEGWAVISHTFSVPSFDRLVFTFASIDLQQRQNAIASAHIRRNAELAADEPTNPDFVLETEIVTLPTSVIPLIHRTTLPTVKPDDAGLEQVVIDIFTPLAKPVAQWKSTFRFTAAYSWQLAVSQDGGSEAVPVSEAILLADALDFQATPLKEIARQLAQGIASWYRTTAPSRQGALLNLAVTVFVGDHLPIIQLDKIPIDVGNVSDAWWSQTVPPTLV